MIAPTGILSVGRNNKAESFRRTLPANHPARKATNPCAVDNDGRYWTAQDASRWKGSRVNAGVLNCADCGGRLILCSRGDLHYFRHLNQSAICIKRVNETPSHWAIKKGFEIFDGWETEYITAKGGFKFDVFGKTPNCEIMIEVICSGCDRYIKKQKCLDEICPELMQLYLLDSASRIGTARGEEYFQIGRIEGDQSDSRRLFVCNLFNPVTTDLINALGPKRCLAFYAGNIWHTGDGRAWEMMRPHHPLTRAVHEQHGILQKMRLYSEQRESKAEEEGGTVAPRIRYRDPRFKPGELPAAGVDMRAGLFAWLEKNEEYLKPKSERRQIRTGKGNSDPQEPVCEDPEKEIADPNDRRDAIAEMHEITDSTGSPTTRIAFGDIEHEVDDKGRCVSIAAPAPIVIEKVPEAEWLPKGARECGIPHPSRFTPETFDYSEMRERLRERTEINNFVIIKLTDSGNYVEEADGTRHIQLYCTIDGTQWPFRLWDTGYLTQKFTESVCIHFDEIYSRFHELKGTHLVARWGHSSQSRFYGPLCFWPYKSTESEEREQV